MAQGAFYSFDRYRLDREAGLHDWLNDSFALYLVSDTSAPAADTADPRWGAGGTTNLSTTLTPSATAGEYNSTTGIAGTSPNTEDASGTARVFFNSKGTAFSLAANASNPSDAKWGILVNTSSGDRCVGVVEITPDGGTSAANLAGGLTITNTNGVYNVSVP